MKAVRYTIFVPIVFIIIGIIYWLIPVSLLGILSLGKFLLVFLLVMFGGIIVTIFQFLPVGISWLSAKISPGQKFAFYTILIVSILLGIDKIIDYWTMPDFNENGIGIFLSILLTCLTVGISSALIVGAGIEMFDQNESFLGIVILFGSIIFYIGIFLAFCLLTTRIAYINPEKTYSWYSGIWHGIFIIPKWVVSWFSSDIYCKAPNSTTAYSIWWWITLIFSIFSILGGGGSRSRYY